MTNETDAGGFKALTKCGQGIDWHDDGRGRLGVERIGCTVACFCFGVSRTFLHFLHES